MSKDNMYFICKCCGEVKSGDSAIRICGECNNVRLYMIGRIEHVFTDYGFRIITNIYGSVVFNSHRVHNAQNAQKPPDIKNGEINNMLEEALLPRFKPGSIQRPYHLICYNNRNYKVMINGSCSCNFANLTSYCVSYNISLMNITLMDLCLNVVKADEYNAKFDLSQLPAELCELIAKK
ncbi:hypothetical protein F-liban_258 [Faustovirus]|nr:hypothetical protein F-liban_258 [Faustovirus]